ncbi:MAG: DNA-binding response regulator [Anaerolineaceae bacterium]|nr:DNA-binding response regulator [Anaerolineaceae bacterium]HCU80670.1 DNA-binding response regulator [Chloroflexota bacterium]|tara:strand:- start:386 stop:1066 length:681 start_codon:yes stop_codon:yes gene_type:complete
MPTILIVEDDDTVREALSAGLESEGYEVILSDNGLDGLKQAKEEGPDLILLDLMLPEMDGLSVCRALRRDSNVPIIMLTARGTEMDKIVGLETGADDYVVKPFSLGELLARIRSLLRRTRNDKQENQMQLTSGDISLDLTSRRVSKDDAEVHLTQKEFNLLAELIRNKGAVLSRDLLLEKVWGYSYVGNTHTVDVHIRWLREKIELDPSKPVRIVTVRGVGYRFEE